MLHGFEGRVVRPGLARGPLHVDVEGVIDAFLDVLSSGTFPMPMLLQLRAIRPLENLMKTIRLAP